MRVGFCTMEKFDNRVKDSVGSSRIRGNWLIKNWPDSEEYVIGKEYDVMIFQKVYWSKMMEDFKGIKILDICDPDWMEGKPVMEYVDLAHATVVSSLALRDYMKKFRPKAEIHYIPDRLDFDILPLKSEHKGVLKSLVWYGYSQNIHYLYKTFEYIIPKGLELTIISDQPFNPPLQYQELKVKNIPYSYPGIHKEIIKHDAVLMPEFTDDLRGRFKSNNKTTLAWGLGIPVIVEPKDIDTFVSAEARNEEAKEKYKIARMEYDVKSSVKEYKALIQTITEKITAQPQKASGGEGL